VQNTGARVTTRHLLILLVPRSDDAPARLGIVASRKVGGAVQRNRAKRLLREVFRRRTDLFPPRVDVVIIVRPGVHELAYAALEAEIASVASLLRKRGASGAPARPPGGRGAGKGGTAGKDDKPRGPEGGA
jgi:ribonuclease P protein component